jgi:hypothetical protein
MENIEIFIRIGDINFPNDPYGVIKKSTKSEIKKEEII